MIEISKIIYYFWIETLINNGFAEVKDIPLKTSVISTPTFSFSGLYTQLNTQLKSANKDTLYGCLVQYRGGRISG